MKINRKRKLECGKEKKNKAKKIKSITATATPVPVPVELREKIETKGGTKIKLVIEKELTKSDLEKGQNRLLMPLIQIKSSFLRGEEEEKLESGEVDVKFLELCGEEADMKLKIWNMSSNRNYAPKGGWKEMRGETEPVSVLRVVYDAGHRYVQELVEKAPQLRGDREWHVIGNLRSNKVKPLLTAVLNLAMVETVDDEKPITLTMPFEIWGGPLKVLIQVSTSGEQFAKGIADYTSTPENFKTLENCRSEVCKALGIPEEQCELSMGMSNDFELAIEMGSKHVRTGLRYLELENIQRRIETGLLGASCFLLSWHGNAFASVKLSYYLAGRKTSLL